MSIFLTTLYFCFGLVAFLTTLIGTLKENYGNESDNEFQTGMMLNDMMSSKFCHIVIGTYFISFPILFVIWPITIIAFEVLMKKKYKKSHSIAQKEES